MDFSWRFAREPACAARYRSQTACRDHRGAQDILSRMAIEDVMALIDAEIMRLREARALLGAIAAPAPRRGRPKKQVADPVLSKPVKKKRRLSPEGRARIAEAVKRRWAKQNASKGGKPK